MNFNYSGGTTVYIKQSEENILYTTDQTDWFNILFPVTVTNNNTSLGSLNIEFSTDITLTSVNNYFICGSSHIQFGNSSLKNDGSRPIITVQVDNYDGLIENGQEVTTGQNNISVYNLIVDGIGSLQIGAGWIGKKGFANSAINNYIINCSSSGNLSASGSGGIVGLYAGKGSGANLIIIGCSSSGSIGQQSGGIVGAFAGDSGGSVTCQQCYSTGVIGFLGGGIFGEYAGFNTGQVSAMKCYANGVISNLAGGIYGRYTGSNGGTAIANSCYSTNNISTSGGGIYGQNAINCDATNCYSYNRISVSGSSVTETNCYIISGSWNDNTANLSLTGIPSPIIGSTWIKSGINQPYELNNIGYTPYNIKNISETPSLIQSFNQTVNAGSPTISAIISGLSYQILDISNNGSFGSFSTITINSTTGMISTTSGTSNGVYTIYIRNSGSYNITQFNLTVNSNPSNPSNNLLYLILFILRRNRYPSILGSSYNKL
jgi:hypothetical protein